MADAGKRRTSSARETMETLMEISKLLNTGLDAETLATCTRLCENGVNPQALARVIQELRRESAAIKASESQGKNMTQIYSDKMVYNIQCNIY